MFGSPLGVHTSLANSCLVAALTRAALPYWTVVEVLELALGLAEALAAATGGRAAAGELLALAVPLADGLAAGLPWTT